MGERLADVSSRVDTSSAAQPFKAGMEITSAGNPRSWGWSRSQVHVQPGTRKFPQLKHSFKGDPQSQEGACLQLEEFLCSLVLPGCPA